MRQTLNLTVYLSSSTSAIKFYTKQLYYIMFTLTIITISFEICLEQLWFVFLIRPTTEKKLVFLFDLKVLVRSAWSGEVEWTEHLTSGREVTDLIPDRAGLVM